MVYPNKKSENRAIYFQEKNANVDGALDKLAYVQLVTNCRYFVVHLRRHTCPPFRHTVLDDVMSQSELKTSTIAEWFIFSVGIYSMYLFTFWYFTIYLIFIVSNISDKQWRLFKERG